MIEDGDELPIAQTFVKHAKEIDPAAGDVVAFKQTQLEAMAA